PSAGSSPVSGTRSGTKSYAKSACLKPADLLEDVGAAVPFDRNSSYCSCWVFLDGGASCGGAGCCGLSSWIGCVKVILLGDVSSSGFGGGISFQRRKNSISLAYSFPVKFARTRMWAATFLKFAKGRSARAGALWQ